jgi:hypothetical protein
MQSHDVKVTKIAFMGNGPLIFSLRKHLERNIIHPMANSPNNYSKVFQNNPSTDKRAAVMIGTIGRTHCTGMQLSRSRGRSIFQLFDGIDNIVAKCQLYGVPHGIFQVFIIKWDVQHWGFGSLF